MASHTAICKNCGYKKTTKLDYTTEDTVHYVSHCRYCPAEPKRKPLVKKKWWETNVN